MKLSGKILFFNANDGKGIIITPTKEKMHFSVEEWDDFDVMPSLGLEVKFTQDNNQALCISCMHEEDVLDVTLDSIIDEQLENAFEEEEVQEVRETLEHADAKASHEIFNEDAETEETEEEETGETEEDKAPVEHFEEKIEVETLDDAKVLQEELGPREESVTVSLNLPMAVANYFNVIKENIDKRAGYKKVEGRLNFLITRRFLWTTFNNINEIDIHIINPSIRHLSEDLKSMSGIYDDFSRKVRYPTVAYEEVFLSCQAEYMKIKTGVEKTIEQLNRLRGSEKQVGGALKVQKKALAENINTQEFDLLQHDLKSLNGAYVDIVHLMAELDERYKHDIKLLAEFEEEYKEEFYKIFNTIAVDYKFTIVDILNAQAFMLDSKLWQEAKTSKSLKAHFHKAGIIGEFNTKTYLKYYLDSQDTKKMTDETKKLHECYEYLLSIHKNFVMIVAASAEDAIEYEADIKKLDKSYEVKAFIDEKASLKWAMKNTIKVLILEERLARMLATTYLKYYKKYILVIPKIIIIGSQIKTDEYFIDKFLPSGVTSRVVAKSAQEMMADKKEQK